MYASTKYILEVWSDCIRLEQKQFTIDVVIIEPGAIRTKFLNVMYQPMTDTGSNYRCIELSDKVAATSKDAFTKSWSSSPLLIISKVIAKAIMARKPRTHYTAGKMASTMIFFRQFLGASIFDKILMSQVK